MPGLIKIFINPAVAANEKVEEAYSQQVKYLKEVWDDDTYGLERIVRLFLCAVQFLFPILLIRDIFGRRGIVTRKLAVEGYTFLKLLLPLFVLFFGFYRSPVVVGIIIYLLSETIVHILHLIFLYDIHEAAVSYHRSVLFLFLHYAEVVLDFATIYIGFNLLSEKLSPISAIYFSLVANATVGFGDIVPQGNIGRLVLISQVLIGVLFLLLFINYFSQKINEK